MDSYEQKYKEALAKAREILKCDMEMEKANWLKRSFWRLFPELKESEDERIRKELIDFVQRMIDYCTDKPDAKRDEQYVSWLAWLERQKPQEAAPNEHIPKSINADEVIEWMKENGHKYLKCADNTDDEYYYDDEQLIEQFKNDFEI